MDSKPDYLTAGMVDEIRPWMCTSSHGHTISVVGPVLTGPLFRLAGGKLYFYHYMASTMKVTNVKPTKYLEYYTLTLP